MPRQYPYWDLKFYYWIHVNKQKSLWNIPCSYTTFVRRLRKGMNLHDAIYRPRVESQVRKKKTTTSVEANIRRREKLNDENVMILDFDEIEKLENLNPPKIKIPKPKKNLLQRFIWWIKKK